MGLSIPLKPKLPQKGCVLPYVDRYSRAVLSGYGYKYNHSRFQKTWFCRTRYTQADESATSVASPSLFCPPAPGEDPQIQRNCLGLLF